MATANDIVMKLSLKGELRLGATVQAVLLIGHVMESGFRVLDLAQRVPKNVIERITVTLDNTRAIQRADGVTERKSVGGVGRSELLRIVENQTQRRAVRGKSGDWHA